jgi:hypothetical protein
MHQAGAQAAGPGLAGTEAGLWALIGPQYKPGSARLRPEAPSRQITNYDQDKRDPCVVVW